MKWISVDDRLPGVMEPVLVTIDSYVMIATFNSIEFVQDSAQADFYFADALGDVECQPTHWMPLPEPPEVE